MEERERGERNKEREQREDRKSNRILLGVMMPHKPMYFSALWMAAIR